MLRHCRDTAKVTITCMGSACHCAHLLNGYVDSRVFAELSVSLPVPLMPVSSDAKSSKRCSKQLNFSFELIVDGEV